MAEQGAEGGVGDIAPGEVEDTPGYVPPTQKSMQEILEQDKTDESLEKYKQTLLGEANAIPFPDDPRKVIVTRLALVVDGRSDMVLDLTGDNKHLKDNPFVLKAGAQYRVKIYFYVQREIVTGLQYVQKTTRKGIPVNTEKLMVGSYGPKNEEQSWLGQVEEVPSGMLLKGSYSVKSLFTDDDKTEHLKWEWGFKIKDDWKN